MSWLKDYLTTAPGQRRLSAHRSFPGEEKVDRWPIVYIRGYAGPTAGINTQVDDPFYGFNSGSTHIRVDGDGAPAFYQFEGPLVRLISDEGYHVYVHGSQQAVLDNTSTDLTGAPSIWVYRFYDQAA